MAEGIALLVGCVQGQTSGWLLGVIIPAGPGVVSGRGGLRGVLARVDTDILVSGPNSHGQNNVL